MSKIERPLPPAPAPAAPAPSAAAASADFTPVPLRYRHDGWTAQRQRDFLDALAASGCVAHAAGAVGLSATSAYALRARPEAQAFRLAWDAALDLAVQRVADAALSRAINGTARPIFFQGEQVGEWRHYDERLTQFILRTRMSERYGLWRDARPDPGPVDGAAQIFAAITQLIEQAARAAADGAPAAPDRAALAAALGVRPSALGKARAPRGRKARGDDPDAGPLGLLPLTALGWDDGTDDALDDGWDFGGDGGEGGDYDEDYGDDGW